MTTEEARTVLSAVAVNWFEDFGNHEQERCACELRCVLKDDAALERDVRRAIEHFLSGEVDESALVSLIRDDFNRAIRDAEPARVYLGKLFHWLFAEE